MRMCGVVTIPFFFVSDGCLGVCCDLARSFRSGRPPVPLPLQATTTPILLNHAMCGVIADAEGVLLAGGGGGLGLRTRTHTPTRGRRHAYGGSPGREGGANERTCGWTDAFCDASKHGKCPQNGSPGQNTPERARVCVCACGGGRGGLGWGIEVSQSPEGKIFFF